MSTPVDDLIAEAAINALDVIGDGDSVKVTGAMTQFMRPALVEDVALHGAPNAIFDSLIWIPKYERRPCLVVIYEHVLVAYWQKGAFKKTTYRRLIEKSSITSGGVGPGPEPETRHVDVLTIETSVEPCRLAMPKGNERFHLWLVHRLMPADATFGGYVDELPAESKTVDYVEAAPSSPAQWAPDPHGRHELRYWDGTVWTEHISNNGVAGTDPHDGR